jgi:ABC-type sugar transport system ATPase subunit
VADRILVMRRGKLVAQVPREEATTEILVWHIVGG